jgi:hypothetical protein
MYTVSVLVHGGACRRGEEVRPYETKGWMLMVEEINLEIAFEPYEESYEPGDKHLGFVERVQD